MLVRAKSSTITIPVVNRTNRVIILDGFKPVAFANTTGMVAIARPIPNTVHQSMHIGSTNFPSHVTEVERYNLEAYRHFHPQDPLVKLTEKQAMRQQVDLKDSVLDRNEQNEIYEMLNRNRKAFSLYGELSCSNIEVDIELNDDTPFYIRPYPTTDRDKEIIDQQLTKLFFLTSFITRSHYSNIYKNMSCIVL